MDCEGSTKKRKRSASAGIAGSTSSASASGGEYEVFLSFRGEDTRKGFTDFLYTFLVDAGIRTFRGNEELRVGEQIGPELLKAITDSKISIPIFSWDYASSKWCLRELAQMVECQRTMGQKILPIFYDVEPSDVRHQTGSYQKAFRRHKKRFDEKTVQGWKEALREVGKLKGLELEKETNRHQGELAKMVVEMVLLELKKNCMVVTDKLVGIDHHVEKMTGLLNVDFNDVRIVGIYGMGGIGKSTIAKVIYNQISERFQCCCFLADVREMSQQHTSLVNLQKQLLSEILKGKCPEIADVDEGMHMIKDVVCRKKVLIVLDDVDEKSQFDKLVGKRDWFGSGSKIIVTTKNKEVLNRLEVDKTYEPPLMEYGHSLQLFCKHAFRRDFPPEYYDNLSKEVVFTCGGLPLALEIIGSLLFREEKAVWEDTLRKLKQLTDYNVQKKLRISYEALNYEQKQIFLDIACLFIGEDKRLAFYMWDDCHFYPTREINVLVLRSLVKIGDDNELRMHDQLRDLGREIVYEENFEDPGERSRLWLHEEALDILERRMGTKKVEALCLASQRKSRNHCFTNKEFMQLPNLRFLRVGNIDLDGDFKHLLSRLRWLDWRGCAGNFTPTNLHLKNLVILDLSCSNITANWEVWSQIKMAKKLKVLDLSCCHGLIRTPDFSTFETLEILILEGCLNLVHIDPSIGNLINLRVLDIAHSGITKLPDAIANLEKLEEIKATACFNLEGEIPSNFGRLASLRILRLESTKICSLPTSICGLSHLQTLDLFNCRELQSLPELPSSLFQLLLEDCRSLESLPNLSNLKNLSELMLVQCSELMDIQGLGKLELLTSLDVSSCEKLAKLDGLEQLKSLRYLKTTRCESLERLRDLSDLKKLQKLVTIGCKRLIEIQGLDRLESLEHLNMDGCISIEILPDLSNLGMLKELTLCDCQKLAEVKGLGVLESLERLDVSRCISLERLPDISDLGMLKELTLCDCQKLAEVKGLGVLESLERLDVSWCISLERLPDISNLGMLKELTLCECHKLAEVEGLGVLKSLERLDVSCCISLERLLDLSNLKNLKELKIRGLKNLTEIRGLEGLESLELLDIAGCKLIEKLPDLSNLKKLKNLVVFRCEKLTELRGLEGLESLELLDISGCKSIEKLPDLSNTKILTHSWEARIWCSDRSWNTSASLNTSSAPASAPAPTSALGGDYEVFLSFRGKDTGYGFTDYLYNDLVNVGVRTCRDNDELHVGEVISPELLKVIEESKISIPIFSRDYASSKWCLLELTQMVKCQRTMGQKILPIFYDVEPSDVQYQTGSYEKAFGLHKKHFNEKTVQGWKEALREVGQMEGWELKKETNGLQGELVKMVVSKVLLELKKNYMVVTENLVGIDHHVEEMMRLLNVDSNDVLIVGIHGMVGIGKTTIAKVIYNQLSKGFKCCSFLANVRETSKHEGLVNLQNQLISKILKGKWPNFANVEEGINMIKDIVCQKKVLIVLDDVEEKSQFDKLAGNRDWFGSGSRIIVTTRNKEVLNVLEVDWTYEPPVMESDHSLQLFSKHAFRKDFPPEDYDSLSRKVVPIAKGFPLALEIIGSFLFGKGKAVWEETLMKLKKISNDPIHKKLAYLENL